MRILFFYGTLCHAPLLERVLGGDHLSERVVPATLMGWTVHWVKNASFPMIRKSPEGQASGVVLYDVSDEDYARLVYYEGGFDYALIPVRVQTQQGMTEAEMFVPAEGRWVAGPAWDLPDWVARFGDLTLEAAEEVMQRYGTTPAQEVDALFPWIRARGWARLLARDAAPCTLRHAPQEGDVKIVAEHPGYEGFFRMKSFEINHRTFDQKRSETIRREAFLAFDAALVLPYDPVSDQVMLVEQMRYGPIWRKDPAPWVLEPIAGLVDAGEAPADCARREAQEEAGIELGELLPMVNVYPSPGYSTEFFHCYLALCDLSTSRGGIGGLDAEHEDIRSHVLGFDHAMSLVDSGEINAAPLVMMLLWLARRREEFRSQARPARP